MKKLTVLIPTIGREKGIENILKFFISDRYKNYVDIFFIFNNVNKKKFYKCKKKYSKKNSNIYFYYSNNAGRFNCIKDIINKIESPYIMFLDDDDDIYYINLIKIFRAFTANKNLSIVSIPTQLSEPTNEIFVSNYSYYRFYKNLISDRKEIFASRYFVKSYMEIMSKDVDLKFRTPTSLFLSYISLKGPALITNNFGMIYKGRLENGLTANINKIKLKTPYPMYLQKKILLKFAIQSKLLAVKNIRLFITCVFYFILWKLNNNEKKYV